MHIILFDDQLVDHFYPLTLTRGISQLRLGIMTIAEKWTTMGFTLIGSLVESHLDQEITNQGTNIYVNSRYLPTESLTSILEKLNPGDVLFKGSDLVAFMSDDLLSRKQMLSITEGHNSVSNELLCIKHVTDLFHLNSEEIKSDIKRINPPQHDVPEHCTVIGDKTNLFIDPTAKVVASTINVSDGPVYIGPNTEVMEGSLIKGPFALCESAILKMGAKIYGGTTIGPWSKVGGEVGNSVILGHSNKAHDGYMGNSILGEWCNLGADTNTSNLKNNYSKVRIWNYREEGFLDTDLNYCGLIMGDHSKCGINTMFNTGTVVGVNANIYGGGFIPKFIPSFSWGGSDGLTTYDLEKALNTAERVMARRKKSLTPKHKQILEHIYKWRMSFRAKN